MSATATAVSGGYAAWCPMGPTGVYFGPVVLRAAGHAQGRIGSHGRTDQGVEAKPLVERAQILVDAQGTTHALDPPFGDLAAVRPGAEQHAVLAQLRDADDDRGVAAVQQPVQDATPDAGDSVQPGPAREAEHPARADLETDLEGGAAAHSPGLAMR